MTGVRFGELGFEGKCDACQEWWPIEREFWPVKTRHVYICRACTNDPAPFSRSFRNQDSGLSYPEWRRIYRRDWMRMYRDRVA